MQLRDYQIELRDGIYAAWKTHRIVGAVSPTGSGKTVLFSHIIHNTDVPRVVLAHRQELVEQISLAIAREGTRHQILGASHTINLATRAHREELGVDFYDPNAPVVVASVQTLLSRQDRLAKWAEAIELFCIDEGHHVLRDNQWGKAVALFRNAKGLLVTATPCRADRKGLGANADGVIEVLVEGRSMEWHLQNGSLCPYVIYAPKTHDLKLTEDMISKSTGDYQSKKLDLAMRKAKSLVGDVVNSYLKFARGKQGVTFTHSVEAADTIAQAYRASGVNAVALNGGTDRGKRADQIREFRNRGIQQIVNVDLLGEGFDVPGIEVVSFARPTESFALYSQQFGRALRPLPGKERAIIIDHVGNVARHSLPDAPRIWTLDRVEKKVAKKDPDIMPVRTCPSCIKMYEAFHKVCPFCGWHPVPTSRSDLEQVDGDLEELSPEYLAQLRAAVAKVNMPVKELAKKFDYAGAPFAAKIGAMKTHTERQRAQVQLRDSMALWGGYQRHMQRPDHESYRRFYLRFGVDVLSAQALGARDALDLKERVDEHISRGAK